MDIPKYIDEMQTNLRLLNELEILDQRDYICPLCKKSFSLDEARRCLTEEHVPQASLAGEKIALTCRDCNSKCGYTIDLHLLNGIQKKEQGLFLSGSDRRVKIISDNILKPLNADLKVGQDKQMELVINTKRNDPKIWETFKSNILTPEAIVDVENHPFKLDENMFSSAILKNAYLLLFARTGYTILFNSFYDVLREQILNPTTQNIPKGLWTLNNINIPDGIYVFEDNEKRGFFVAYTISKLIKHKVAVFIPVPCFSFEKAAEFTKGIQAKQTLIVIQLGADLNFKTDLESMKQLLSWSSGK